MMALDGTRWHWVTGQLFGGVRLGRGSQVKFSDLDWWLVVAVHCSLARSLRFQLAGRAL